MSRKPKVRFTLDIFKDVKKLCSNSNSRDFELDSTSFEANKRKSKARNSRSGDEGESQRPLMHSKGKSSTQDSQQKRRPLVQKQQVEKVARPKRGSSEIEDNNNSKDGNDLLKVAATPRPKKKSRLALVESSPDSDENAAPVSNLSKSKALLVPHKEKQSESSDDGLLSNKLSSKTAPTKMTKNDPEGDQTSFTSTSHPGFPNPGFMCYMNATLQGLFASKEFCDYLWKLEIGLPGDEIQLRTLSAIVNLSKWANQGDLGDDLDMKGILRFFGEAFAEDRLKFDSDTQHDAHEFVEKMLEALQKDVLEYVDDKLDICKDLFMLTSTFLPSICTSCGRNVSPKNQKVHHLIYYIDMVDAKDGESIQMLIDKNLLAVFEQRCCQNDISCVTQINTLSKILLVGLKRYSQNRRKIITPLEISTELVLAKFNAERSSEDSENDIDDDSSEVVKSHSNHVYQLVGIVNHIGSRVMKGHYVTYVNDSIEDSWVMCNDSRVKKVDLSKALCDSVATCYLLVYEAVERSLESTVVNDTSRSEASIKEDAATDEESDSQTLGCDSENEDTSTEQK